MIIEVKNKGVFYPNFGGNLDLPENERLAVEHRFLLPEERKKYIYINKYHQLQNSLVY